MEISAGPYSRVVMFGCVDMIAFDGLFFVVMYRVNIPDVCLLVFSFQDVFYILFKLR